MITHGATAYADRTPSWGLTLLHLDGANGTSAIVDESGKPFTRTGACVITTADSKFGGSCMDFLTTGNNRYATSNNNFSNEIMPGLGPFTIECFFKFYDTASFTVHGLVGLGGAGVGTTLNLVRGGGTYGTKDALTLKTGNLGQIIMDSGSSLADGAWHHGAVCRDADGLWSMWVDGVLKATSTAVWDLSHTTGVMTIGNEAAAVNGYSYRGLLDEVRVIKGKAMYSGSSLVVPTAPFAYAKP